MSNNNALPPDVRARIDAIRQRRAAIKNPWHLRTRHLSSTKELCAGPDDNWDDVIEFRYDEDGPYIVWKHTRDLDFAVHAPDDIDALLALVDTLLAERTTPPAPTAAGAAEPGNAATTRYTVVNKFASTAIAPAPDTAQPEAERAGAKLNARDRKVLETVKSGSVRTHQGSKNETALIILEARGLVEQGHHSYWHLTDKGRAALAGSK